MRFAQFLLLFIFILFCQKGFSQDSIYNQLNTVIVSANKSLEKRTEAPIAISVIGKQAIQELKANRIDFLMNRVSGVYMPSIGNEQHMMAIRQPISLKGLYLYLEDGMPIRTSGLFSNNALIELNTGNIERIEVIKGPASALYGAEAIGGVLNFITMGIPKTKEGMVSGQWNSLGLKKIDLSIGQPTQQGGWNIMGTWANQSNGPIDYSNYEKKALSAKHVFKISNKLSGFHSLQYIQYFTQMTGPVDSIYFSRKDLKAQQSFTYRKINALRIRQNVNYQWSKSIQTLFNIMYRDNRMDQNPTYAIAATNNPTKFKGQNNSNYFNAWVLDLQQSFQIPQLHSQLSLGANVDRTRQNLIAHYIDITKDTSIGKFVGYNYPTKDSLVTNYSTSINNNAIYANLISHINKDIKLNIALRYDYFNYNFNNALLNSTPSSKNNFSQFTPKIGFTYNKLHWGGYANYSTGFAPPQITEIYNAIRVPYLLPQTFKNTEMGAWFQKGNWQGEFSVYQLLGENEIISVRQTDGVNLNQNSGSTKHIGIEYQLKYKVNNQLAFSWNGTNAKHTYQRTSIKGINVSGNEMVAAPRFWSNFSTVWKANKSLTTALEWQHQSGYFMDEINATKYPGFNLLHLRLNYQMKQSSIWLHVLNLSNVYYSTMATKNFSVKGNAAYSYYIGEPRSISIGWNWMFGKKD
jgi:outer membrane receptor protein involved in Fe transport